MLHINCINKDINYRFNLTDDLIIVMNIFFCYIYVNNNYNFGLKLNFKIILKVTYLVVNA